jgi:hypothetical protein
MPCRARRSQHFAQLPADERFDLEGRCASLLADLLDELGNGHFVVLDEQLLNQSGFLQELLDAAFHDHLGRKLGAKRDIPSVGATITVKKKDVPKKKIIVSKIKKPRFYLIQLGNTAKLKALNVIELLRKNKISVYHSLTKDKIVGQLSGADYTHASHVLIIGQKEAIENTVVVRDCATREQETVPIDKLTEFLKKLEK